MAAPHLARLASGAPRPPLLASGLMGAAVVTASDLVARVVRQTRVQDGVDLVVAAQVVDDLLRVVTVPVHPDAEGLDAAQGEEPVERSGDRPGAVLQERERLVERVSRDLDDEVGVGQPQPVAHGGAEHGGIVGAFYGGWHCRSLSHGCFILGRMRFVARLMVVLRPVLMSCNARVIP